MAAIWTNNGLNLIAQAVRTTGTNAAISYVGVSTGCGTLASALTSGNSYSSLSLDAGLPSALAAGASITITDGVNTQTATVSGAGASGGATSIPLAAGFTASFNFAAHTTGVAPTPLSSDITLYNESQRVALSGASGGAGAGENIQSAYFDGTQPTATFLMVGFFGGSTASSSTGTGVLMLEDIQYWSHSNNVDSNLYQADSFI